MTRAEIIEMKKIMHERAKNNGRRGNARLEKSKKKMRA